MASTIIGKLRNSFRQHRAEWPQGVHPIKSQRGAALLLVILGLGCESEANHLGAPYPWQWPFPSVAGAPGDVQTKPGVYDGYEVIKPCTDDCPYGVLGTGSKDVPGVKTDDVFGGIAQRVGSVSAWSASTVGCRAPAGASIDLDDWQDVDALIEELGKMLKEYDWRLDVAICVNQRGMLASAAD